MDPIRAIETAWRAAEAGHWDAAQAWAAIAEAMSVGGPAMAAINVADLAGRFFAEPDGDVFAALQRALDVYQSAR